MVLNVKRNSKSIIVESPYNPFLPEKAKNCGGEYIGNRSWEYPLQAQKLVEKIYIEVYGVFEHPVKRCTIRCYTPNIEDIVDQYSDNRPYEECGPLSLQTLVICSAKGRDTGARVAKDVVLVQGKIKSGGSMKYWKTIMTNQAIFEVYNVPVSIAEKIVENPQWCEKVEIIEENGTVDYESLQIEKNQLLVRINEINKILEQKK